MDAQTATPSSNANPPRKWMEWAKAQIGTQEVRDNTTIVGWARQIGGWIGNYFKNAASIPWCGLFADEAMTQAGLHTPGQESLGALNWRGWGQALTKPIYGAVLVFQRPGGGHVGFYTGEDATSYFVLGGNQSNSVCIERIAKARCVAIRWPYELNPVGLAVQLKADGTALSTNEA